MPYIPNNVEIQTPRQPVRTAKPEVPLREQPRTKQRLRLYNTLSTKNWDVPAADIFPHLFDKK